MAPAVSTGRKREKIALAMGEQQKQAMAQLKALSEKMRENADYVGDKFAEEARKIHFGETDPRGIYGEATPEEARSLAEDGVGVHADPGVSRGPQLSVTRAGSDTQTPSIWSTRPTPCALSEASRTD